MCRYPSWSDSLILSTKTLQIYKCFKLLLTAIQVRTLRYVPIRHKDDFPILDDPLGNRRERWGSIIQFPAVHVSLTCVLCRGDSFQTRLGASFKRWVGLSLHWTTRNCPLLGMSKSTFILRKLQLVTTGWDKRHHSTKDPSINIL